MGNIFVENDFKTIKSRIESLTGDAQRRWGKMTVVEMLYHCIQQLKLALNEIPSQPQGSFILKSSFGKWLAFSDLPWPKGSQTPTEMNIHGTKIPIDDIDKAKLQLTAYVTKIRASGQFSPHPFFGTLTKIEWGTLIYKHLDHHLRQFNV